ncbi:MAG TPA: 50S ribosomal protein L10 [Candidatus Aminicenantes bacterium]|nr:50S ribosomal protein L10 [Candidatus Aminicenantes bacterium]
MKKADKTPIIESLERLFASNDTYYLVDYKRMTVAQAVELRKLMRKNGYAYKVIKNRLALRALGDRCPEALRPYFQKPTAVAFAAKEPIALARILRDFSNQGKVLAVKGGQVEGRPMPGGRFDEVSRLPSREELLGRLAGMMAHPLRRLLGTLRAPLGDFGALLGELKKTKDV